MGRLTKISLIVISISAVINGLPQEVGESPLKELLQAGGVQVKPLDNSRSAKSLTTGSLEDDVETFIKSNELLIEAPFGTSVSMSGRNLDLGEVEFKLRTNPGNEAEARKKSKVKKILSPILIILLLKAITFIPLALGVLGIKTWNALQLSFVSFVTSIALAVWKLTAKFGDHHIHHAPQVIHEAVHDVHIPHVYHDSHHDHHVVHHDHHHLDHFDDHHHHDPWEHPYHRSDDGAQQMVYNGYVPEIKA